MIRPWKGESPTMSVDAACRVRWMTISLAGMLSGIGGCHRPAVRMPLEALPLADAARIVNANIAAIPGTVRAIGSADGHVRLDGRRRSYHADGTLFYLGPRNLRFDLRKFGESQVLVGSNQEAYWVYTKDEDQYYCGRHDREDDLPEEIPLRADQMIDALGLRPIPAHWLGPDGVRQVQRVEDEHQQVLFLPRDDRGQLVLEKEYWLDRFAPRLVRRVIFRDAKGDVVMEARLDGYRREDLGEVFLPGEVSVRWPQSESALRFQIRKWSLVSEVTEASIQFATPPACQPDQRTP